MSDPEIPEADRAPGACHPRETLRLFGQSSAEASFLDAYNSGRLHHGWLLTGSRGIGKATLAWRIARFLLAQPVSSSGGLFGASPAPETLDIPADHPVMRRSMAMAEPRLFVLRPAWDEEKKRLKQGITVDEARKLKAFFQLSAADGGRRVVIVDAADELNNAAANALLKLLEEPPAGAVLLLVAHQPHRLLPTIRSRCRELRCNPLGPEDIAAALEAAGREPIEDTAILSGLAGGSVGQAIRFLELGGIDAYAGLVSLFSDLPRLDRPRAITLAETFGQRGQSDRFALLLDLLDLFLARLALAGTKGPPATDLAQGEIALLRRMAPDPFRARRWAELQQELGQRARQGNAVNLDPAALILDMVLRINQAAAELAA